MKYKIILLLISSLLFTSCNKAEVAPSSLEFEQKPKETLIWDSNSKSSISQKEYDDVMFVYVKSKYPEKMKAYKIQQKREKLIRSNTLVLGSLMWQDNFDAKSVKRNWQGAKDYCKNLSLLGYSDWRLGNDHELRKLYSYKNKLKYFRPNLYWSSTNTTYESDKDYAWGIDFGHGFGFDGYIYSSHYVRCVRAGQ